MLMLFIYLFFGISANGSEESVKMVGDQTLREWVTCKGKSCDAWRRDRYKMAKLLSLEAQRNRFHVIDFDEVSKTNDTDLPESLENCIQLSDEQIDVLLEHALTGSSLGMRWRNSDESLRQKRGIRRGAFTRWKMPVTWKFSGEQDNDEKQVIRSAFHHWEQNTCVRFREVSTDTLVSGHHIMVTNSGNGCYSYIGQVNLFPQPINLQRSCLTDFGVPVHEIGHALGMWHEHQRPDRDQYIRINRDNLKYYLSQFVVRQVDSSVILPYDYSSVMHYGPKIGSPNQDKNTMETLDPLLQRNLGQRVGLSHLNSKLINFAYCNATCNNSVVECLNDGYQDPKDCRSCKCPDAFSGKFCGELRDHVKDTCGGVVHANSSFSTIESPGYIYPFYYKNGQECNWLIKAPTGYTIQVEFVSKFSLYSHNQGQCYHWIELNKGPYFSHPGPRLCGFARPDGVLNLGDGDITELSVIFRSKYKIAWPAMRRGFRMRFRAVATSDSRPSQLTPSTTEPTVKTTTNYTTTTSKQRNNCSDFDVVFLIDSSGSVGRNNWAKVLRFIADYSDTLLNNRVAVISYGSGATVNIRFEDKFSSQQDRRRRILSLEFKNEWTNTAAAIQLATDMMNANTAKSLRNHLAVLVTNGPANTPDAADYTKRNLMRVAKRARRSGLRMMAIGIGREASAEELNDIVGINSRQHPGRIMFLWSYDNLLRKSTLVEVNRFTCDISTSTTTTPSSTPTRRPTSTTTSPTTTPTTTTPTTTTPPTTTKSTTRSRRTTNSTTSPTTTTSVYNRPGRVLFSCDFETDYRLCGMIQSIDDDFDWTRTSRSTPSVPTGPSSAYSGHYYLFIEASNPRRNGDKAEYEGVACLRFRYHMYGFHVNELSVTNRYHGNEIRLWKALGAHGNRWNAASARVDLRNNDQIVFTGVRGSEYSGDIGLDFIQIFSGECN